MNVIICNSCINGKGGGERAILEIAKKFNAKIYTAYYDKLGTYPEFSDFEVRQIHPSFFELPLSFAARIDPDSRMVEAVEAGFRFASIKIKEDYDVLNPHSFPCEFVAFRNERVSWYCHSPSRGAYDLHQHYLSQRGLVGKLSLKVATAANKALDGWAVKKIDTICANSEIVAKRINKYLNRYDVEVIHPGVDASKFECRSYSKFFFYPSRFIPEKRQDYAIEAFRLSGLKGWKLVFAGYLPNTARCANYLTSLKKQATGLNVEFVLCPSDAKMRELYSDCYATLFCGIDEDWGLIPLESMASYKPIISVNEGGPTISVLDGKTGFLVNSPAQMAEKMRILASNPDACEKMGKVGRVHVEKNYTWKTFISKIEKVFRKTAKS
ncbi:MAG: glycosyltransferase [Candidatus Anstonellaceae archaeon]